MIQLIIIGEDGSWQSGMTCDPNMVSRFESGTAIETWQAGYVHGELAVRLKSVSSLNALLRYAGNGDYLEVMYRARLRDKDIREIKEVRFTGRGMQPLLMPGDRPALTDAEIVAVLGVLWGEYISVSYRLLAGHAAPLHPEAPNHALSAYARATAAQPRA